MRMPPRLAALALAASLVACNNYQFNPAGSCILQPGSTSVALPRTSSADFLFVVDDSPSMDPKQAGLAASFQDFIQRVVDVNVGRASRGLEPIDFQIAVTTSSIFNATPLATACVGGSSCCQTSSCTDVASCVRGTTQGCSGGQVCVNDFVVDPTGTWVGGLQARCCTASACTAGSCSPGDRCASLETSYTLDAFCTPGLATAGEPYPAGRFVAAPGNPKVLAFPKALDWASWTTATPDPRLTRLVQQFQQNVQVGSCGSGEEQHLEAGYQALALAASGGQPGLGGATFPRASAKLVVVYVGDEDDCSNPAGAPLGMPVGTPGADACVLDKHLPAASQREYPVSRYAKLFHTMRQFQRVADVAAAFIVSAVRCAAGSYAPADSCAGPAGCPVTPPASCAPPAGVCGGAYAAGERFFALADLLKADGITVVEGTVCDAYPPASFGPVLAAIADLARPPAVLELPSLPAARAITNVRITDASGATVLTCRPGVDWCFVDCASQSACLTSGTSQCIAIDHTTGQCEANPGQTYWADYLGMVPAGGCATASDCATALGGPPGNWSCVIEQGMARGTCACSGGK
jgi:hypothetical protein